MQCHRDDKARHWPVEDGGVATHRGDGLIKLSLPVFCEAPGEHEPGMGPAVDRWVGRRGPPGEGRRPGAARPRLRAEQTGPAGSFREIRITGQEKPREQSPPCAAVVVLAAEEQAQFGVSVPGIVIERIALKSGLPGDPRSSSRPCRESWVGTARPGSARVGSSTTGPFEHRDPSEHSTDFIPER